MAKVGKILLAVVTIAAVTAISILVPGSVFALGVAGATGTSLAVATGLIIGIGTLAVTLVSAVIGNALFGKRLDMGKQKVNVRLEDATRWNNCGPVMQGGAVAFSEHDANGDLWVVLVHCDSILTGTPQYYFDNILVTVDPTTHEVTTADFTNKGKRYWRIWTHTYSETDPVPTAATELATAFPTFWDTASHMLVGTTYSVLSGKSIKLADRYKVYKWRGAVGLGEPNVAIVADWSNVYDPRDPDQTLGDRSTYKPSRNSALVWAWWRTHRFGRNKPESEINWDRVAEQADICDQSVVGIETTQKRYECAIAAQDNVDRATIEANIILSCDGQLVFDDDGRTWMRAGAYYTPTLTLGRNRDIISMSTMVAQDGESETQGVIVKYIDHNAAHTVQPSAAWYNPNYYVAGQGNTFLTVEIPTIFNHNQAMRVAKGIGMRSQPTQKIAPTTGLRGIRAMQERVVDIVYDNEFAGDYEIISPVDVDESGFFCSLEMVPINADRWTLLPGEEKPRPNANASSSGGSSIALPTVTSVSYFNGHVEAIFNQPDRDDVTYEFQIIAQSDLSTDRWLDMAVDMDAGFAASLPVDAYQPQLLRWRAVTAGGSTTEWFDPPYLLDPLVMSGATNLTVDGGTGEALVTWRNPADVRFFSNDIYRNTIADFGTATLVFGNYVGGVGESQSIVDTVGAGTYFWWVQSRMSDGTTVDPTEPVEGIVT